MIGGKRVWDCFTFFNELDLLEIRLNELVRVVDKVILCEATRTFAGNPKPLHYAEHADDPQFRPFKSRIVHVVVDDMPVEAPNRWVRDFYQRDQIARAWGGIDDDDLILVSDADEIPRPSAVEEVARRLGDGFLRFSLTGYYYYLNGHRAPWNGTMAARARVFRTIKSGDYLRWKNKNRYVSGCGYRNMPVVKNGGWHFSYCESAEQIAQKIHSWAHAEHDKPKITDLDTIRAHIDAGEDIFGRPCGVTYAPLDSTFPAYVLANRDRFKHLIREP